MIILKNEDARLRSGLRRACFLVRSTFPTRFRAAMTCHVLPRDTNGRTRALLGTMTLNQTLSLRPGGAAMKVIGKIRFEINSTGLSHTPLSKGMHSENEMSLWFLIHECARQLSTTEAESD